MNPQPEDLELVLLSQIAARISSEAPLAAKLNESAELLAAMVECDACMIYVLRNDHLVLCGSSDQLEVASAMTIEGIVGGVAVHCPPVVARESARKDVRFKAFTESSDRCEIALSVPLVCGASIVGEIQVRSRVQREYPQYKIDMIATLGFLIACELENSILKTENILVKKRLETSAFVENADVPAYIQ